MKMVRTAVAAVCIMSSCVEAGSTFSHLFGGNEDDVAYAVTKADDGYIVAGKSESFSNHRDSDAYVVKIDLQGEKLWSKVYGGRDDDVANDITTVGSDAVFVGTSESYGSERNAIYMSRLGTMGKPRWNTIYFYDENDEYFGTAVCHKGKMLFLPVMTDIWAFLMRSGISTFLRQIGTEICSGSVALPPKMKRVSMTWRVLVTVSLLPVLQTTLGMMTAICTWQNSMHKANTSGRSLLAVRIRSVPML